MDHRPLLHRLRPPGARHDERDLRGCTDLPRCRSSLADRRATRGDHVSHGADRHPHAAQARPRRTHQVRLPLQAHDHRRRAHRARGVALVPPRRGQGRSGHRRHLVADRERRLPRQHPACLATHEARQLRARRPGDLPGDLRRRGNVVEAGSGSAGNICIRNPWPGIFQTIWGQPDRFVELYYQKYCKDPGSTDWRDWPYLAGDGAVQAADGYFRILGRIDDVINVSGHRLGTKELESASITVEEVAEAAAVPVMDDLRGRAVEMYVSLKPGYTPSDDIAAKVVHAIETEIGSIARPKNVWIVSDMPKTRSGKIMRRVIAAISNFADVGDITTLSNPEIVADIRLHVQAEKVARGDVPRELSAQEQAEIDAFGQAE